MNVKKEKIRRDNYVQSKKEASWNCNPSTGIPQYNSQIDRNCPQALVVRYNKIKEKEAKITLKKELELKENWIRSTLKNTVSEIAQTDNANDEGRNNNSKQLEKKSGFMSVTNASNLMCSTVKNEHNDQKEAEILQKVIVRENLVNEVKTILEYQNDINSVLLEVEELIKAIRFQTVDVVECISNWISGQLAVHQFLFHGHNYLIKLSNDLAFLDKIDVIRDHFGFSFALNPMIYPGGSLRNVSSQTTSRHPSVTSESFPKKKRDKVWGVDLQESIDGIDVFRLKLAERNIKKEFDRIKEELRQTRNSYSDKERLSSFNSASPLQDAILSTSPLLHGPLSGTTKATAGGAVLSSSIGSNSPTSFSRVLPPMKLHSSKSRKHSTNGKGTGTSSSSYSAAATNRSLTVEESHHSTHTLEGNNSAVKKLQSLSTKRQRIGTLAEDIGNLEAMIAHLEEQIESNVKQYDNLHRQKKILIRKKEEALTMAWEAVAQRLSIEISLKTSDMQHINDSIRDFQRQSYFLSQEKRRKELVVQQLKYDIGITKKRKEIEKVLIARSKEKGLVSALRVAGRATIDEMEDSVADELQYQKDQKTFNSQDSNDQNISDNNNEEEKEEEEAKEQEEDDVDDDKEEKVEEQQEEESDDRIEVSDSGHNTDNNKNIDQENEEEDDSVHSLVVSDEENDHEIDSDNNDDDDDDDDKDHDIIPVDDQELKPMIAKASSDRMSNSNTHVDLDDGGTDEDQNLFRNLTE